MNVAPFQLKRELRGLLTLGLPIILTQLIQVSNTTVAILMMGRVGSIELAALGLGGSFMIFVFLVCLGIMMSLSPTIAQHFGAGRIEGIRRAFQQGLWLVLATGISAFFLLRQMGQLMHWIGVDPEVIPLAQAYLNLAAWSMPATCLYLALRFLCEATGHSRPMLVINIATLPVVVVGNWALIFGHWGLPALGVEGAALNLILVMSLNAMGMLVFVLLAPRYRARNLFVSFSLPSKEFLTLLKLGLPIAGTLVLDSGFFSAIALMMGKMGHLWLAAHQVAINYATIAFMIPVSLSSATMARVGQAMGQGDPVLARQRGFLGISASLLLVVPSIVLILAFPQWVAGLYTGDLAVIQAALPLLLAAAMLQIFDATYITAQGALRGLKDVNGPMLISLSFWVCGLPAAWLMGLVIGWGAVGLWWGMVFGVALTAVLLVWRFHWRSARTIRETRA
ncbi:MAG: MATE family efflux transporter [Acidiferrobacteraceae bacterium]|nr:MATE family efflux transporter [Acidiferrobacteraceae bacterium]HJP08044.1 MATE family efflux transporter [Arenicellales bacterium]|tara:strand:- start:427 stop:1779 length:1353 start_codon:yes stop_codon:yes gene_type:complete